MMYLLKLARQMNNANNGRTPTLREPSTASKNY
jgi:hypothetical protein